LFRKSLLALVLTSERSHLVGRLHSGGSKEQYLALRCSAAAGGNDIYRLLRRSNETGASANANRPQEPYRTRLYSSRLFRVPYCEFRQRSWSPLFYVTEFSAVNGSASPNSVSGPDSGGDDGEPDDNGKSHPQYFGLRGQIWVQLVVALLIIPHDIFFHDLLLAPTAQPKDLLWQNARYHTDLYLCIRRALKHGAHENF